MWRDQFYELNLKNILSYHCVLNCSNNILYTSLLAAFLTIHTTENPTSLASHFVALKVPGFTVYDLFLIFSSFYL